MTLLQTPLTPLHRELGAKLVPFAGYEMPVQFSDGILKEHRHTREAAGLFDVSHMGQVVIRGDVATAELEALVPADLAALPDHHAVYSLLLNQEGGVLDDLIITRWADDSFFLVVNADCKVADVDHLRAHLPGCSLEVLENRALLAVQGPRAREVLSALCPDAAELVFMTGVEAAIDGVPVYVSCCGYTGEDGFELSIPAAEAERLATLLLDQPGVAPIGLGARDSLRLEAGLCLYGHELSASITPIQAGLKWAIAKARRVDGARPGGYPGAQIINRQWREGIGERRVGLRVKGKRPVRDGQLVCDQSGQAIGRISSSAFGASVGAPIAMAFVAVDHATAGTLVQVDVRGKIVMAEVVPMPFVPPRYYRG
nr:glycine cleavage system aminomethyltransferase GcvT [Luminiphilus syltensis]